MVHQLATLSAAFLVAAGFVFPGCQSTSRSDSTTPTIQTLKGEWTLQQIEGKNVRDTLPEPMRVPNLKFHEDGAISGFGGVNRISTRIDLDELALGELSLAPIISTKMAGPPEAMNLEARFLGALEKASDVDVGSSRLDLIEGGKTLLRFTRHLMPSGQ